MYWLGLDVGTGGSRALLVDAHGRVQYSFTSAHEEMRMLKPLWAEQDPDDWWRASTAAIAGVMQEAGAEASDIGGIGLTGRCTAWFCLTRRTKLFVPHSFGATSAVRSKWISSMPPGQAGCAACHRQSSLNRLHAAQAAVVRENEPEKFETVRRILLPKDYLRFKLTGEHATDVSDASGTAMFDVVHRTWSNEIMDGLSLDRSILPRAYESAEITGHVVAEAAAATGLRAGIPVVAGAGDQAASAIGNGITKPGTMSCTIGTSGVVFAYQAEPAYDEAGRVHTFCHAVPNAWHVMGVTQGAGLSLQWFRNRFAPETEYDDLTADATRSPAGGHGLFWLPYLMGERTPHLDANARAAFIGLTAKHQRADMVRAILEGVCYSQKDGLEIINKLGAAPEVVRLSGGGGKSSFWHQLFADIFDVRVATLKTQEGSAYGAALLALVGTGQYKTAAEVCDAAVKEVSVKDPDPDAVPFYQKRYALYQSLYPALRSVFQTIGELDA